MQILQTDIGSNYYYEGVAIRKHLFFEGFSNFESLINDPYEDNSIHIVVIKNKQVIGTGRLTVKSNTSIISQMTVIPKYQKTGIGSQLLNYLLNLAKNHKNISTIQLSARLTATTFYSKHHFIGVGEIYPSKKTGILHQLMVYSPLNK